MRNWRKVAKRFQRISRKNRIQKEIRMRNLANPAIEIVARKLLADLLRR
jgi:hypothetical protein